MADGTLMYFVTAKAPIYQRSSASGLHRLLAVFQVYYDDFNRIFCWYIRKIMALWTRMVRRIS